ncbi:MAG: hypothetical protein WDZ26_06375, partial [Nitriliruptoraceae bacterium]
MIPRTLRLPPEFLYPADEWAIVEQEFSEAWLGNAETIFSLSNGFLGIRGIHEEGRPALEPASFVNGFHETWPILHAEQAYGFARTGQTIVNVPDVTLMKLYVDDEPLHLPLARITEYERRLDLRSGVLRRDLNWSTAGGKQVRVRSSRLVSFVHRHVGAIELEIEVDTDAPVVVSSQMLNRQDARPLDERNGNGNGNGNDPRRAGSFGQRVLNAEEHVEDDLRLVTGYRTSRSRIPLGVGIDHSIDTDNAWRAQRSWSEDLGKVVFTVDARAGVPIRITKYFAFHTSRTSSPIEVVDRAGRSLDRTVSDGYPHLEEVQRDWLADAWSRADVEVDGPVRVQQAVRWNIFQLLQASARA